jgi:hypothetical protein
VDFDTECCWNHQKINFLKKETRNQLNFDVIVKSKLHTRVCFPSRRVKIKIKHYPNIQPIHLSQHPIGRPLGLEDEDELGW